MPVDAAGSTPVAAAGSTSVVAAGVAAGSTSAVLTEASSLLPADPAGQVERFGIVFFVLLQHCAWLLFTRLALPMLAGGGRYC